MRRPYRLHRGPCEEEIISPADFGLEPAVYSVPEMQSKRIAATAFIWLCKLSEIMAGIAVFQQQTNFSREWNGVAVGESTSELEEVIGFDREIGKWKDEFESGVLDMTTDQALAEDDEVPMPVCILRIVCKLVPHPFRSILYVAGANHSVWAALWLRFCINHICTFHGSKTLPQSRMPSIHCRE